MELIIDVIPNISRVGRPRQDPHLRLELLVGHNLEFDSWPNWKPEKGEFQTPCWHNSAAKYVHWNGKSTTFIRAAFCLLLGVEDLHPTWRAKCLCRPGVMPAERRATPVCLNPHHWRLEVVPASLKETPVPLPESYYFREAELVTNETSEEDLQDCIDQINSWEAWDETSDAIHTRMSGVYDLATITEALTRISQQRREWGYDV